jgi:hypothetical protein
LTITIRPRAWSYAVVTMAGRPSGNRTLTHRPGSGTGDLDVAGMAVAYGHDHYDREGPIMPRRRATATVEGPMEGDRALPGMVELAADPEPAPVKRGPGRPRKVAAGNAGRIPARTPSGKIASRAAMQSKVRDEIHLYLSLVQAGWELRDPVCASAASPERLASIADSLVAMVSRSDSLLEMAAKSGIVGDIAMLLHAVFPIAKAVWQAHGPNGHGHRDAEEVRIDNFAAYPPHSAVAG